MIQQRVVGPPPILRQVEDFYLQIIHVQASKMEEDEELDRSDDYEEEMLLDGEVQFNEEIASQ